MNNDLQKIFEWDYEWKILFNPHLNKEAQQVIFSKKLNKPCHPKITFNSAPFVFADWEKHVGMFLDKVLNVNLHIKENMSKAIKGIGVIQKLSKTLSPHSLITTNKSFVRPHLDFGDITYDQQNNANFFTQKIERIQCNDALTVTGVINGTSSNKLYSELGFESLKFRRWVRKLCIFFNLKQVVYQNTCLILFHKPIICTILACWKMLTIFYSSTAGFK